ncbi:MAG TPA: hypothetical protein VM077_05850 [Candidatus Limnocylindrales bacterium]|nr:hypothetical protein [Candidatus Limnocylindrales bacterium]
MNKKHHNKSKYLLFILFLASIIFGAVISTVLVNWSKEKTVVITDSGFSPSEVTILQGEKVIWVNKGKRPHWPASDAHPAHSDYPEPGGCLGSKLDSCRGLKTDEKYEFVFNKTGTWGIHDHLYHGKIMTVNVVSKSNESLFSRIKSFALDKKNLSNECKKYTGGSREQEVCFSKEILKEVPGYDASASKIATLIKEKCDGQNACYAPLFVPITQKKGSKFAFDVTFELRKIDKLIGDSCHSVAHQIGWATYRMDPQDWKTNLKNMDNRCSWGALHGMVEEHIDQTRQELDKPFVKTLCSGDAPCNHGVGHLILVQTSGDIPKALDICTVLPTFDERHHCMSGVFMEKMTLQNTLDREFDPVGRRKVYWADKMDDFEKMCESFKGQPHIACWTEMARPAVDKHVGDPQKIFEMCARASTQEASNYCRRRSTLDLVPRHDYDLQGIKYICELGPESDTFFRRDCYMHIAFLSVTNLPLEKRDRIVQYCASIPIKYKVGCEDILNGESFYGSIKKNKLD